MEQTIGIIGVGMIGGSIGAALIRNGNTVIGYDSDQCLQFDKLIRGIRLTDSIAQLVAESEIIIIATPISSLNDVFIQLKAVGLSNKIITDVSSVKQTVVEIVRTVFGDMLPCFVPGHPIAGSENSGAEFAKADLFVNQKVILSPLPVTDSKAVAKIQSLWQEANAEVTVMDCVTHDQVLALTSHLPHALVYSLMHYLCNTERRDDLLRYSAGGFQDFTRVAASSPNMWRDICVGNREYILTSIEGFQASLQDLYKQLKDGDDEQMRQFFKHACQYKKQFGR